MRARGWIALVCSTLLVGSTAPHRDDRTSVIRRAQVWTRVDVANRDLKQGPRGQGAFPFHARIACSYVEKTMTGHSPKFTCLMGEDDELKVKYGGTNGEVYGEVLATRLLWALGFGADRMYAVDVICNGCPETFGGIARPDGTFRFDPASVERKFAGRDFAGKDGSGWKWTELDLVSPKAGGATRDQVDALKLLAVFMQHTDSKPQQQRIVCRSGGKNQCGDPFLMISDLGLTFGRANWLNVDPPGSVNLKAWRETPVWKGDAGCTGNLPKSFSGTLENPVISDGGRAFLARLLMQLSDRQLSDLFEGARVTYRLREPGRALSGYPAISEWVDAFKAKRQQIVDRRCA